MTVTFNGTTIVADSVGVYYGESKFILGDIVDEVYDRTVPRANGTAEVTSGYKFVEHTLNVTYFSQTIATVWATLWAFRKAGTYGSLVTTKATVANCRLSRLMIGPQQEGTNSGGTVTVVPVSMTFKQVLF